MSLVLGFVHCFFANRRSVADVDVLGEKCIPPGLATDWAHVHSCVTEDVTSLDHFEELTAVVHDAIKEDGLVVRIGESVHANAKNNLIDEFCTYFTVIICCVNKLE